MARQKRSEMQFRIWMSSIQRLVHEATGLGANELPLLDYRAAFNFGDSPEKFFEWALQYALADMGFALELRGLIDYGADAEKLMAAEGEEPYAEGLDEAA